MTTISINGTATDYSDLLAAWTRGNDAGEGYEVELSECSEILYRAQNTSEITIARKDDRIIGIGDANGPWGVTLA